MPTAYDPAILEFCNGAGIPVSLFMGRVVEPGESLWTADDRAAALEYQAYRKSLCPGCNRPRAESFDVAMDDRYDVTTLECHACAARDRRAYNQSREREDGTPMFGRFYAVMPEVNGAD